MKKQHILGIVAGVLFLAAAVMIVRTLMGPAAPELTERQKQLLERPVVQMPAGTNLPPQGDMTNEEYARYLMKLREEANPPKGEAGSARQAIQD